MKIENKIKDKYLADQIVKKDFIEKEISKFKKISKLITNSIKKGGSVFLAGNGGSYADAEHLSAEMMIRIRPHINRKPIPVILLGQHISNITATSNDYHFELIFVKNLLALNKSKNDVVLILSTSGNSQNLINLIKTAKKLKIKSIGFLGKGGGKIKNIVDENIIIKSNNTALIQENHKFIMHLLFESVEDNLLKLKFL